MENHQAHTQTHTHEALAQIIRGTDRRERERERARDSDRERERERGRDSERERETQRERLREREREGERERERGGESVHTNKGYTYFDCSLQVIREE